MMIITLLFSYNSTITTQYLEQNMTIYECLRRCTGICNESRVTCMKELWMVALPQIQCQLHDHAKQYDSDGVCHNKRNGGKLHVNISRNGYGNAIIGIWCVYGERCAILERLAMVEGRKVHMIHGLNISHKELIYLLQKFTSYQSKVLRACS